MKYNFGHIMALMVVALMVGCAGESYPGLEYDYVLNEDIINTEGDPSKMRGLPIEVFAAPQSFATTTRGVGPFDMPDTTRRDSNHYENARVYILAFRDTLDYQGFGRPNYTKHSNDANDREVSCLIDDQDKPHGMLARFDFGRTGKLHMKQRTERLDTTLYYSATHPDVGYNFFVYNVDDMPVEGRMHRDETGVWYDAEIDGTQDLMYGHSPLLTPEVLDSAFKEQASRLSPDERNHVLNIGNFSGYAARYDIHPYVELEHALTRLRFRAYAADKSADSVFIDSIIINSRYKGEFHVVAPYPDNIGVTFTDERRDMLLQDNPADVDSAQYGKVPYAPLAPERYRVQWDDTKEYQDTVRIGGDIMAAPDTELGMTIIYRQKLRSINPYTGENDINRVVAYYRLSAPKAEINKEPETGQYMYLPGRIYNVTLGIYGMRPLEVSVSLEGWSEGEEIITPED